MTATATRTTTWTYTATRAQVNHFGTKLGGEIRNLLVRTGLISEERAVELRDDICAYMSRGFASGVKLQLLRGNTVEFELNFGLGQWDGYAVDQRGRGYKRPDTRGLSWNIRIETTDYWHSQSASAKQVFYEGLSAGWGPGEAQHYSGTGSWSSDVRHHVHSGSQLSRSVFSV